MGIPIATATRQQIRQFVGDNIGAMIASSASATGSPTTLSDQYALIKGGQDEYVGWQIMVNQSGTVAADYAKRFVTASSAGVLTLSAALAATTVAGNAYELWRPPYTIEQMNNHIKAVEEDVTPHFFIDKLDETTYTQIGEHRYALPSGFLAIHTIEYVEGEGEAKTIEQCASAWSELVDADVTASTDTDLRSGETWLKLVIAAGASANDILATQALASLDLRDCTEVEMSVYSNSTLAASAMQLLIGGTAQCATPTESLNWPAITAKEFTRFSMSLTATASDSAMISTGIKLITDATFTLYVRNIRAVRADSRRYEKLYPQYWKLVRGTTNYIDIDSNGKSVTGNDTLLRISGYRGITNMASETSVSQVDSQYIADVVASEMLLSHNPTPSDRARGEELARRAALKFKHMVTPLAQGTRWI